MGMRGRREYLPRLSAGGKNGMESRQGRLRGRGKHRLDYRHIIDWLVRSLRPQRLISEGSQCTSTGDASTTMLVLPRQCLVPRITEMRLR